MSRTTLDLDASLVSEAMALAGASTKTEAIETALREYVRYQRRRRLIESLGQIELTYDHDELMRLRQQE